MSTNLEINVQPGQRIYYSRGRKFVRVMSHILTAMFILWGLEMLYEIYRDPSFAPMLLIFIPVTVYSLSYYYALANTCVITSETGIEYRRPEFSIFANWSQVQSLKRNIFLSLFGDYYLIVDRPNISYTKWLGLAYKFQLSPILFPKQQKRIPIGKMWEFSNELEDEIHTKVPSLAFETSRGKVAG